MNRRSFWIRLLLSGCLVGFLLYTTDIGEALAVLGRSNPQYLALAYCIALCDRVLMAYKWNILLRAKEIRIPLVRIAGTYLISTFLGLFLPATIGGDALRAYAISRDGHSTGDVVSSIIVERLLGFVVLFISVLISIGLSVLVFGQNFFAGIWNLFWLFLALLVVFSVFIISSLNESMLRHILTQVKARYNDLDNLKVLQKLHEVYRSYRSYQNEPLSLAIFASLSLVEGLFPLFWTYALSMAFGLEIPLLYFFILVPIVLVLVRLPISLDGIGIQEGAFVYFLTLIGVAASEALLLGIASHVVAILAVLPGGLLYSVSGLSVRTNLAGTRRVALPKAPLDMSGQ